MARTVSSAAENLSIHNLLSVDKLFYPSCHKNLLLLPPVRGAMGVITPQNGYRQLGLLAPDIRGR